MSAFQLNASGELVKLMADRPVGLAVGAEFRNHSGSFQPNPITGAGENTGNNYLGTRGSYNTSEAYAELSVPVVSGMVGVENLEATLAGRFFHYSNFGSDSTYKFGVRYSPIREVTLRGTYSTAFRAPGISDLYLGVSDNFPTLSDPCSTDPGTGTLRTLDPTSGLYTQCNTTGVTQGANAGATANNGDDRTQIKSHNGGNANLKPEKAKVFTFGVVTEPVKNLSVTLDYYNIKVTNAISTIGAGLIADSCFTASPNPGTPGTASTPQKYCNLIHRVPIGQINYIDDLNQNIGGTAVAGLDLAARYDLPTEVGRFNFIFDGTYLLTYDTTQADGSVDHGAGNYDFLLANPKVKFNTGVRYGLGGLGAGLSLKYVGTYKECDTGFCSVNAVSNPSPVSRTVKAWTPIDAFVSYALPSSYGRTSLAVGMNNVFDQNPPFVYNNGTYPSDPSTYDFLGRYMYLRLTHSY
jgi:outer membrane receptor protein involved in Fe transport